MLIEQIQSHVKQTNVRDAKQTPLLCREGASQGRGLGRRVTHRRHNQGRAGDTNQRIDSLAGSDHGPARVVKWSQLGYRIHTVFVSSSRFVLTANTEACFYTVHNKDR